MNGELFEGLTASGLPRVERQRCACDDGEACPVCRPNEFTRAETAVHVGALRVFEGGGPAPARVSGIALAVVRSLARRGESFRFNGAQRSFRVLDGGKEDARKTEETTPRKRQLNRFES